MYRVSTISLAEASDIIENLLEAVLTQTDDATVSTGLHSIHGRCSVVSTTGNQSILIADK